MCAELALAIARILGDERSYIQLARATRHQPGTTIAQHLTQIRRSVLRGQRTNEAAAAELQRIEDAFAREQLDQGARTLGAWLEQLPPAWYRAEGDAVLREVACKLQQHGYQRPEYVLLSLHVVTQGLAA
jgi:hypothetical protein